jgi:hypothetical protein
MNIHTRLSASGQTTLALVMPTLNLLAVTASLTGFARAAPASPDKPAEFAKPIAHDAEFFPITKAYVRAGDLMRATVIRNDKTVAMTTNSSKWKTRISWLNAVTTPGVSKALTFSSVDDVRHLIQYVPKDVNIIEYNMEGAMTPSSEFTDIPQTVAAFSQIVRATGRKFAFGPVRNTWTALETKGQLEGVLKNCDSVAVQMQRSFQAEPTTAALVEEVRPLVQKFKAANPNLNVNVQLWLGRQAVPQMIKGFRALEPYLDVAVLGTHSNSQGVLEVLQGLRGASPGEPDRRRTKPAHAP